MTCASAECSESTGTICPVSAGTTPPCSRTHSATAEAGKLQRDMSLEANNSLRATMESEGVTFAEADHQAYVEATASIYDKYSAEFPELVEALRAAASE